MKQHQTGMYKVEDGGWCQKQKRYKELNEVKPIVNINKWDTHP